ncbi:FH2 domain-containing protein 1-like [Stigmatopora nigra]
MTWVQPAAELHAMAAEERGLPPPAPPPPPPLPPSPSLTAGTPNSIGRTRSFFWRTIPEEQVRGRNNLWTQGREQQRYRIDADSVEELFGQIRGVATLGGRSRGSARDAKDQVSILDAKRAMNMSIFLKQFKRSNQAIVDDISGGHSRLYGAEPLRELTKLLPEADEVKKIKAYRGDLSKLSSADSFVVLLVQLPSYATRVECMLYKEEIPGSCEALGNHIGVLRAAAKEVLSCRELHAVLHLVLQAGNILDAVRDHLTRRLGAPLSGALMSTHAFQGGQAAGFKLSSLLSLADTKANKPGMNLLHFVALEAQKRDQELLDFPSKLDHVQAASRISLETLDSELQLLTSRTRALEDKIQTQPELLQQMDAFLGDAAGWLLSLRANRRLLSQEAGHLKDFFCEDGATFRPDECFAVLHAFCCKFSRAVKENREEEAKERARRRRLQALEEQKRHSWAGGEEVTGALGSYYRSETNLSLAGSPRDDPAALLELLLSGGRRSFRGRPRLSPTQRPSSLSTADFERPAPVTLPRESPVVDAGDDLSALLEKCSLVPEGDADHAHTSPPSVTTAWCVTVLCEAEDTVTKDTPSFTPPPRSEPVSCQPPPSVPIPDPPPSVSISPDPTPSVSIQAPPPKPEATRSKRVRTLNSSEKQSMRRVVPISRTAKDKRGEKPSAPLRVRDPKDRLAPRNPPGEKMCRSSLRTNGNTIVASTNATPPAAPRFARGTASSSFRQTHSGTPRATIPKCPSEASLKGERLRVSSSSPKSARTWVNGGVAGPSTPARPSSEKSGQSPCPAKIGRPTWR